VTPQQQQQQGQQYGNFMATPPMSFQMQTMQGMKMLPQQGTAMQKQQQQQQQNLRCSNLEAT